MLHEKSENHYVVQPIFVAKDILSFKEAAQYLDLSESSLYKLTSESKITFHKGVQRKVYQKTETK